MSLSLNAGQDEICKKSTRGLLKRTEGNNTIIPAYGTWYCDSHFSATQETSLRR